VGAAYSEWPQSRCRLYEALISEEAMIYRYATPTALLKSEMCINPKFFIPPLTPPCLPHKVSVLLVELMRK
jgi:hypothetical protein